MGAYHLIGKLAVCFLATVVIMAVGGLLAGLFPFARDGFVCASGYWVAVVIFAIFPGLQPGRRRDA
jgi:hypothetical protein